MNLLTAPMLKALAIALAASLLANAGLGLYAFGLRAERTLATERLGDAPRINALQNEAINTAIAALDACVGLDAFIDRQWTDAQAANAEATRKLNQAIAINKGNRETTYANDADCRTWAAMPVCDAIDDGL